MSKSMPPKISIVTPSYNQSEFLERTIRCVLDQDYPNLEYIIIDGGSNDGSVDIIKKYADRLAFWCSEPDEGQTDAIVKGFRHATGDILAYLNSDDVLLPGSLALMGDRMTVDEPQWAIGWQQIIDEHDQLITRRPVYPFSVSDIWFNQYLIPQECTFFNRKMYDLVGGFDAKYHYAMDMHAWLRMASVAAPLLLRQYVGCFRIHSSQKTCNMRAYFEEAEKAVQELQEWRLAMNMSGEPDKPRFSGRMHRIAKALFYLRNGGFGVLKEIYHFQKTFRSES